MRIAIIDLGSNTFNLLIRDTATDQIIYSDKTPVRLAEGGINEKRITGAAVKRAMQCLQKYRDMCQKWQVQELYALGTSALRDADNRELLIQRAAQELQIHINVIRGSTEAALIYKGVQEAFTIPNIPTLIMDIGGGSTEFIISSDKKITWQHSFDIGSSRLLDSFKPGDPLSTKDREKITDYLMQALNPLWDQCKNLSPQVLIGSSGSFETLAAIASKRFGNFAISKNETQGSIALNEYWEVSNYLKKNDLATRLKTPGMIAMRAHNIVMACMIIDLTLKMMAIKQFFFSLYALKEGAYQLIKTERESWQKSLL